jgi:hypothetical protein
MSNSRVHRDELATCLVGLALVLAGAAAIAASPTPAPSLQNPEELDEVIVEGRRSKEKPKPPSWKDLQRPLDWLARLVGRFVVDGYVDLHGNGNAGDLLNVQGRADCVGFGMAPAVLCNLKLRWPDTRGPDGEDIPGGTSSLNPAVIMYGYDPATPEFLRGYQSDNSGIQYILVDSHGLAQTAVGNLVAADTMQSRSSCVELPGDCERVVRITALPDLKSVEMRIELVVEQQRALRFLFVLHRVPGSPSVVYGRKQESRSK